MDLDPLWQNILDPSMYYVSICPKINATDLLRFLKPYLSRAGMVC